VSYRKLHIQHLKYNLFKAQKQLTTRKIQGKIQRI